MTGPNGFQVRFLLATNLPVSVTRITADTANYFVRSGVPTTVTFPSVDWWDYRLFILPRLKPAARARELIRLGAEAARSALFPREWCARTDWEVDTRVRLMRYQGAPPLDEKEDEITVVHHTYAIARALRRRKSSPLARVVGVIHTNLEKAIHSASPEAAAWYRHWVELERALPIPRFATSEDSRRAAERLGIPIRRVIPGGVDLKQFRPGEPRAGGRLVVSLYCFPHLQKGRQVGLEALRELKSAFPAVTLCSIGEVTREQAKGFDVNYGYLRGRDYVRALQGTDLFVYPSLYDGFPAPPLQAMACGAALVTTAVEGVVEYARHGENCLICPPGDPAALRAQTLRLLQEESLRGRVRAGGLETAREFSADRSSAKLLDFLREVYAQEAA